MNTQLTPLDMERALLGSVLIDPERIHEVNHLLAPDSFSDQRHRAAWQAIGELLKADQQIDALTICDELDRRGKLAEFGGMAYAAQLIGCAPTSVHAESYARSVAEQATRRRLLSAATDIARMSQSEMTADAMLTEAGKLITLCAPHNGQGVVSAATAVSEWCDEFTAYQRDGELPGLTTGYGKIDAKTNGLRRGEMMILAGRPGMGKTSLAAQMSVRQARAGLRVGVVSLEEHYRRWVAIAVGAEAGVNLARRDGDIAPVLTRAGEIHNLPLAFNERGGRLPMSKIEWSIRRAANALGGLDVIWLDHLGYIDHATGRNDNTAYAVGQTTKALITLAKEYDAALCVLCQINRAGASEDEPQLIHLRDSGEIEQDARQVWMIHTPGYYSQTPPADDRPQESRLLVRKNSNGPTGKINMAWVKSARRFAEMV